MQSEVNQEGNLNRIITVSYTHLDSREKIKNLLKDANENGVKISHQAPTLYDVVPKEEIAEFEELMRKTINEMLQELLDVSQFILAMMLSLIHI